MFVVIGVVAVAAFELYAVLLAPSVDVVQAPVSHLRLAVAVHVVGREAQGGFRLLAEEVQVAVRRAVMLRVVVRARLESVLGVHLAEYGGFHLVVGDDVDRLVAVAVVDAREFGLIAQLVEHLHRLHRLGGQGLDGRGHVVAEKLAAVDEDLLHRLALRLDAAAVHRDAGHLGQQLVGVGVGHHLISRRVVDYGVAVDGGAHGLRGDAHGVDLLRVLLHHPSGHVEGLAARDRYHLHRILVTERRCRYSVLTLGHRLELECAAYGRGGVFLLERVAQRREFEHGAHYSLFLLVDYGSVDGSFRLREDRDGRQREQETE